MADSQQLPPSLRLADGGWRWLTAPTRHGGVDLARGLAVVGMLTAHLMAIDAFEWSEPHTWIGVVNGRSSILFAVLAGVSIALVSGGATPLSGQALRTARGRLAVRALALWALGLALIATGVPVYVILPAYALLFLLALGLLTLRAPALWVVAAVTAVVMPWLQPGLDALPFWEGPAGGDLSLVIGWHYPFTVWFAFVALGMAVGRSGLGSVRTQVTLLVAGAGAAAVGYGAAAIPAPEGWWVSSVWTAEPHSSGLWEVIGSGGFALAVIGASLLLCRTPLAWVAIPLRAVGAMPLTAYVGQLIVWAILAAVVLGDPGDLSGFRALEPLVPFILTTVAACTAWAVLFGRGPLERAIGGLTRILVPGGPRP